jgi:hyperosmotically inducible protein
MTKKQGSVFMTVAAVALGLLFSTIGFTEARAAQKLPQTPESEIQREVGHQLRMLNFYTVFDNLEYGVDGTRVILQGQVTNPDLKSEAIAAAKSVRGVTDVQDKIRVLSVSNDDDRIRREAYRLIYGDPQLTKYGFQSVQAIHIIVEGGHITLEGNVNNDGDRNIAGIRANSVTGAFSVKNNLMVHGEH